MSNASLRLDRWLWFSRFFKTRTAATAAVKGGHVRVNGERGRAATQVRVGDEIKLQRRQLETELVVLAIPERRGAASDAQSCYAETPESAARREMQVLALRRDRMQMPMTRGRPDKHTRRRLRDKNRRND